MCVCVRSFSLAPLNLYEVINAVLSAICNFSARRAVIAKEIKVKKNEIKENKQNNNIEQQQITDCKY